MAKTRSKAKTIFLRVLLIVLAVLVVLGCVITWVPGFWHRIDFFPQYKGILDSPITEITLRHGGYWVTVTEQTDPDIIDRWEEGLNQLELQKTRLDWSYFIPFRSGCNDEVTLQTETGTYSISCHMILCDTKQIFFGPFFLTANDWENFPFEETYSLAAQRQGMEEY